MLKYVALIPLAPLAGFVLVGMLGASRRLSDAWAGRLAVLASLASFLLSCAVVADFSGGLGRYESLAERDPETYSVVLGGEEAAASFTVTYADWLPLGEGVLKDGRTSEINIGWTFSVDALTLVMLLVVSGIGTLIHVYSIGYMAGEKRSFRFFAYLNLFMAMMLTLVLGGNLLVMFIGWEGVGLCSYLLIGYLYTEVFDKETGLTCAGAGTKAFIVNRIGDFAFILGALLLLTTFGTWEFGGIADAINSGSAQWYGSWLLTGVGVLLFIGATGKSAQIPLYVWLPDAMAGPTPVSALIHAATMVTAGVYMLARVSAIYWHAPGAMFVVAAVGCMTALFAATMGMAQYDIKKVLAYSTVSQLGYMFLGAGVGAFAAAVFHLVTHAFFKACLFLGSGSVILRTGHSNDMRLYGGLKRWMPVTYWTFLVSTLAITGLPFLSGFMSKDEILAKSLFSTRGHMLLWLLGTLGAVMTSFYMFRAVFMTFHGENRSPAWVREQLRESPAVMTGVLTVLAIGAVVVGFLGVPQGVTAVFGAGDLNWFEHQLHPVVAARGVAAEQDHGDGGHASAGVAHGGVLRVANPPQAEAGHDVAHATPAGVVPEGLRRHPTRGEEAGLLGLALLVFLVGLGLASWAYGGTAERAKVLGQRLAFVRRLLHRKWFVDELYEATVIGPFWRASDLFAGIDRRIVDGAVNLTGAVATLSGQVIKLFQTGVARHYAMWLLAGAVLMLWLVMM